MRRRHWRPTDNTDPEMKLALRRKYAAAVEPGLCFDLFCGSGHYLRAIYAETFRQVVAVDKRREALRDLPRSPNVAAYRGDNVKLAQPLVWKYGFPDFVDLDAYGNPDTPLTILLKTSAPKPERFAVVGTDGTLLARSSFAPPPEAWGLGKGLRFAPFSLGASEYPVLIYRHAEEWLRAAGYEIEDLDCYRPEGHVVFYWGALAVSRPLQAPHGAEKEARPSNPTREASWAPRPAPGAPTTSLVGGVMPSEVWRGRAAPDSKETGAR